MLNKVPGATISKFYLDNDATPEYDGELIKGDYEYDISVDAVNRWNKRVLVKNV